jgi:hypothetical protein
MGGLGSGTWYRWQSKKTTVEESLTLGMKDLRWRLHVGTSGSLTWTRGNGHKSSIGYYVTGNDDRRTMTLHYRWADKEDISIPVRLTTTPTQFGGPRWWFICPLIVGGRVCERRAGKLHLPPGAKYFGCRKCHDLTYRSSQEAHQTERLFGRLGFATDVAKMWDRMHK